MTNAAFTTAYDDDEDSPHPHRITGADEVRYAVESEDEWLDD